MESCTPRSNTSRRSCRAGPRKQPASSAVTASWRSTDRTWRVPLTNRCQMFFLWQVPECCNCGFSCIVNSTKGPGYCLQLIFWIWVRNLNPYPGGNDPQKWMCWMFFFEYFQNPGSGFTWNAGSGSGFNESGHTNCLQPSDLPCFSYSLNQQE